MIAPRVKMMAVKDFVWKKDKPQWVPLGEGIVKLSPILKIMKETGFAGPISIHIEYDVPSNEAMLDEFRKTAEVLRRKMSEAGYSV
jgi:sugar phosphate isomerase/epimerase